MMRAGEFDRTITLQTRSETVGPSGAVEAIWFTFAALHAKITEAVEEDTEADPQAVPRARLVALVHWRGGVTTEHRLTYQGRAYAITRTVEVGPRRGLEIHAVAT